MPVGRRTRYEGRHAYSTRPYPMIKHGQAAIMQGGQYHRPLVGQDRRLQSLNPDERHAAPAPAPRACPARSTETGSSTRRSARPTLARAIRRPHGVPEFLGRSRQLAQFPAATIAAAGNNSSIRIGMGGNARQIEGLRTQFVLHAFSRTAPRIRLFNSTRASAADFSLESHAPAAKVPSLSPPTGQPDGPCDGLSELPVRHLNSRGIPPTSAACSCPWFVSPKPFGVQDRRNLVSRPTA